MYRVLLVEDDTALRFIYKKMKAWSECGFTIASEASNGKIALELLQREQFDLVFTDIRMPFVDGIELLKTIKDRGYPMPVIFASSYDEFEYARQGLVLGAFDYLLKPVEQEKLSAVLSRAKAQLDSAEHTSPIAPVIEKGLKQLGLSAEENPFVNQAAIFFSEHYGDQYTVDDIAEHFGYSKDYFSRIFKQNFGVTFQKFYIRVKVAYAIDLLTTGNYKIYEISEILGFSTVDYFTKVFKEVTGTTPSAYQAGERK